MLRIKGKYRLSYYPETKSDSGWNNDQTQREELLTLKNDSTYILERIKPQGNFEIAPVSGTWKIIDSQLALNTTRLFDIGSNSIKEPNCVERDDLSNVLWKKE